MEKNRALKVLENLTPAQAKRALKQKKYFLDGDYLDRTTGLT